MNKLCTTRSARSISCTTTSAAGSQPVSVLPPCEQRHCRNRADNAAVVGGTTSALPTTTVLATMSLAPLPGEVLVELDTSIALALVDRLLGGRGGMYTCAARPISETRHCGGSPPVSITSIP